MYRLTFGQISTSPFTFCKLKRALVLLVCLPIASCSTMYARLTYDFYSDTSDGRISYEEGTKEVAAEISARLDEYIKQIETAQFGEYTDLSEIRIFIFDDKERYSRFAYGTNPSTFAGANNNEIFVSYARIKERRMEDQCQENGCPETIEGLMLHELSHIHLRQVLGNWKYRSNIPFWFSEGLVTLISGGAGAGMTTEVNEIKSIKTGSHLIPEHKGSIFRKGKVSGDLRSGSFRYYRQSQMFVNYLRDVDPVGFQNTLTELRNGQKFRTTIESNYDSSVVDLWEAFVDGLKVDGST